MNDPSQIQTVPPGCRCSKTIRSLRFIFACLKPPFWEFNNKNEFQACPQTKKQSVFLHPNGKTNCFLFNWLKIEIKLSASRGLCCPFPGYPQAAASDCETNFCFSLYPPAAWAEFHRHCNSVLSDLPDSVYKTAYRSASLRYHCLHAAAASS